MGPAPGRDRAPALAALSAPGPPGRRARRPLPPYAYRPGRSPHPRRHPGGHARSEPEPHCDPFAPEDWTRCETYLHGLDLFDAGFWWEAHEAFEAVGRALGPATPAGHLLRALVQLAAAELKRAAGGPAAARLAARALCTLAPLPGRILGLDVPELAARVRAAYPEGGPRRGPPLLLPVEGVERGDRGA